LFCSFLSKCALRRRTCHSSLVRKRSTKNLNQSINQSKDASRGTPPGGASLPFHLSYHLTFFTLVFYLPCVVPYHSASAIACKVENLSLAGLRTLFLVYGCRARESSIKQSGCFRYIKLPSLQRLDLRLSPSCKIAP